jgi:hypothetical protein
VELTDADVAVIESAYAELQLSDTLQCTSAPEVMTLDVSTDTRPGAELLLAGETTPDARCRASSNTSSSPASTDFVRY